MTAVAAVECSCRLKLKLKKKRPITYAVCYLAHRVATSIVRRCVAGIFFSHFSFVATTHTNYGKQWVVQTKHSAIYAVRHFNTTTEAKEKKWRKDGTMCAGSWWAAIETRRKLSRVRNHHHRTHWRTPSRRMRRQWVCDRRKYMHRESILIYILTNQSPTEANEWKTMNLPRLLGHGNRNRI